MSIWYAVFLTEKIYVYHILFHLRLPVLSIYIICRQQHIQVQIQEKFDATPPAIYLSLEKIVQLYKDRRSDNGG